MLEPCGDAMPQTGWPVVMCPGCKVPMGVKLVVTGRPGDPSEVTYACVICESKTVRRSKLPTQLPTASREERKPT
jgi:hypothetical protein